MEAQQQKAARATGESAAPQATRQPEKADRGRLMNIAEMLTALMAEYGTSRKEGRKTYRSLNLYSINFESFRCIEKRFPDTHRKHVFDTYSMGYVIKDVPYDGNGQLIIHTTRGHVMLPGLIYQDNIQDFVQYAKLYPKQ